MNNSFNRLLAPGALHAGGGAATRETTAEDGSLNAPGRVVVESTERSLEMLRALNSMFDSWDVVANQSPPSTDKP